MQSNAFDKSIETVPITPLLSKQSCHFLSKHKRESWTEKTYKKYKK